MIKLDSIVLQSHEKFEEALDKILLAHGDNDDDDDEDDEDDEDDDKDKDSGFAEEEHEEMNEI